VIDSAITTVTVGGATFPFIVVIVHRQRLCR
jgi:hypothetical protein